MFRRIGKLLRLHNVPRLVVSAGGVSIVFGLMATWSLAAAGVDTQAAMMGGLVVAALGFIPLAAGGLLLLVVNEHARQIRALINVRPLLGDRPLRIGDGWAADPILLEELSFVLETRRPRQIVELGSGSTTILIAEHLRMAGSGRLISVDHDEGFASLTKQRLVSRGLDAYATVVTAPLSMQSIEGRSHDWYSVDWAKVLPEKIDLLIVDGPPARFQRDARFPAGVVLEPYLSDRCVILLDDGARRDERRAAIRWARRLGCRITYMPYGKGMWTLVKCSPT